MLYLWLRLWKLQNLIELSFVFRLLPFSLQIGTFGYTQGNQFVATHDDQLNMYRFIACLYQVYWLGGSCFAPLPPSFVCALGASLFCMHTLKWEVRGASCEVWIARSKARRSDVFPHMMYDSVYVWLCVHTLFQFALLCNHTSEGFDEAHRL